MITRLHRSVRPIALLVLLSATATAQPDTIASHRIDEGWVSKWREDLAFAKRKMPETHIRIDHTTPLRELDAAIDDLALRIPTLAHHQAVVELARIVALIGDGHTRLTLPIDPAPGLVGGHRPTEAAALPGTPFHHYPVRFFLYDDGLAVERIAAELLTSEHPDLLGARVLRIGSMTAEQAMAAVEPTIQRDNDTQVRQILPSRLVIPALLHAQGVIDILGPLELELETPDGAHHLLTLEPAPSHSGGPAGSSS